jgi:ankyrin repeat protein
MDIFKIIKKDSLLTFYNEFVVNKDLLNTEDSFGNSLLLKAIFCKSNKIAFYLIDNKYLLDSKDKEGWDIYRKAVLVNNADVIAHLAEDKLIDIENEDVKTALLLACKLNHEKICQVLFDYCNISTTHKWYMEIINYAQNDIQRLIKVDSVKIREPVELYPRDDLSDLYTMEDILPGVEYGVRINNDKYYCVGSRKTVDILYSTKYKSNSLNYIFDLVQNKLVPYNSVYLCVKNECPEVVKKIYNNTFREEDFDPNFKDIIYDYSLLDFATNYDNKEAIEICLSRKLVCTLSTL